MSHHRRRPKPSDRDHAAPAAAGGASSPVELVRLQTRALGGPLVLIELIEQGRRWYRRLGKGLLVAIPKHREKHWVLPEKIDSFLDDLYEGEVAEGRAWAQEQVENAMQVCTDDRIPILVVNDEGVSVCTYGFTPGTDDPQFDPRMLLARKVDAA